MTGKEMGLSKIIAKAQRTLNAAKHDLEDGDFESASSRAYYAVFHIIQAALLMKGLTFSKHSAVIGAFSRYFIKTGIFPKDFSKKIRHLMMDREIGDYSYMQSIGENEAKTDVNAAEEVVNKVNDFLNDKKLHRLLP